MIRVLKEAAHPDMLRILLWGVWSTRYRYEDFIVTTDSLVQGPTAGVEQNRLVEMRDNDQNLARKGTGGGLKRR